MRHDDGVIRLLSPTKKYVKLVAHNEFSSAAVALVASRDEACSVTEAGAPTRCLSEVLVRKAVARIACGWCPSCPRWGCSWGTSRWLLKGGAMPPGLLLQIVST